MYHVGHAKMLEQAKNLFPFTRLVAGVSGDEETLRLKGKLVNNEYERKTAVEHCKSVDEVICPCPWIVTVEFMEKNKLDFVAHDEAPYGSAGDDDIYAPMKKIGKFIATQRTPGVSTSDIIMRILKDYDDYILRSLQRGYSRKELGISFIKE